MKRILLLICISLMALGLWGCSAAPAEQSSTAGTDSTAMIELDSFGTIITVPADIKNGDILPDGNVYFDEVIINSMDDAVALLNQYDLAEEGSYTVLYVTPEYYGAIMYQAEDNLYSIAKVSNSYSEEYTYGEEGLISSGRWEDDTDDTTSSEPTKPVVLKHGEKDNEGRVYIDTDVVDIGDGKDIDTFFDLIEEHYGEYDQNISYKFVTDDDEYMLKKASYGYYVRIRPIDASDTFTEEYYEYGEDKVNTWHSVQSYKDGKYTYVLQEKENYSEVHEYLDNNVTVYEVTENGITTTHKYQSIDGTSYTQYYKDNKKEVTLTYDASGTGLIRYTSVNFKDGCTYDWVLDGNGNETENIISVTITKNGSSKTYTGRDEIPWGSPMDYPPHVAGAYE